MEAPPTIHQVTTFKDLYEYVRHSRKDVEVSWLTFVDEDGNAYYGETLTPLEYLSPAELRDCLHPIPDGEIYPAQPEHFLTFSGPLSSDLFVKRPNIIIWGHWREHDPTFILRLLQGDLEAFEGLKEHPHKNMVRYHGALVSRGRVIGLVMGRHTTTLRNALQGYDKIELNNQQRAEIYEGLLSVISHLHNLGYAHNDLKPSNVMLDTETQLHLIDFGSCKPFGNDPSERGHVKSQ